MTPKKQMRLHNQVLLRVLPVTLVIMVIIGGIMAHLNHASLMVETRDRLSDMADRSRDLLNVRLNHIREQIRTLAKDDLVTSGLTDPEKRRRQMPVLFRLLTTSEELYTRARFSLLDANGGEILSNGPPPGPTVIGKGLEQALAIILSFTASVILSAMMTARPVEKLTRDILNVSEKRKLSARLSSQGPLEIQQLADTFNSTMASLEETFTSRTRLDQLIGFARIIQAHLGEQDLFGRYGGEEFLAIVRSPGPEPMRSLLEGVKDAVAGTPIETRSGDVPVTVSIGMAGPVPGKTVDELLAAADRALYKAKDLGRNRVIWEN